MKQAFYIVISVAFLLMLGWTVYDFMDSSDNQPTGENGATSQDGEEEFGNSDDVGTERGDIPPDFELETLEGETIRLSDYEGKKVIVNFWATWCPPCRKEIPDFKKLYNNKDVEILAINLEETEKSRDDVKEFVHDDFEMPFPVPMDEKSDVAELYDVIAYPTSYMIDSEGYIQYKAIMAMDYETMEKQLDKMN